MRRLLTAGLLVLGLGGGAYAQGLDMSKGGPIEVTARDGIEWRQNEQVVIARGDARAVRGDVTVVGDTLIAHYRRKANASPGAATTVSTGSVMSGGDTGANEIYRLEADGHVKIFNLTDIAVGDHAIYDIDQAVLVMTGKNMSLTTPNHVMTARDTMEWWSQSHMAVGRGLATVTTSDGKRLSADVLVGYTAPDQAATPRTNKAAGAKPATSSEATEAAGKLQKVEAFGHVEVRTATETITGDRGVYVAATDISRLVGHVHITRGLNQLNGDEALINMKTGVSTLVRNPGSRVQGLIVPNDTSNRGAASEGTPSKPAKK
ncbi:MAG: LptA/OstA family protein [Acetobacteraceae bacterium]|nr:LptA/OstA family protein [Acetobacteraceae bacterium]